MSKNKLPNIPETNILWSDKKRYCGFPVSFTTYSISEDRIFLKRGFVEEYKDETLLYRIKDIGTKRTLWQKMCGVGTIILETNDTSSPILFIKNIRNADDVKELIHINVEKSKKARGMGVTEIY